jgi:F-type H+-transporting ATPase subunit b
MPQLDTSTFAPQLVWLAISFIALYALMAKWALPRIRTILDERRRRIDGDLAKAAQMKEEAEAVIKMYERALAEARADAQATLRETIETLNAEAAQRQRKLAVSLAAETAAAEARIAEARNRAMADLREVAVDVMRAAAQKLTGVAVEPAAARAAVDAVLRERA